MPPLTPKQIYLSVVQFAWLFNTMTLSDKNTYRPYIARIFNITAACVAAGVKLKITNPNHSL